MEIMIESPHLACPVCNKTGSVVFQKDLGRERPLLYLRRTTGLRLNIHHDF